MKRSSGYGMMIGAGALGGAAIALGVATFSAMSGDTAVTDSPAVPVAEAPPQPSSERSIDLLASSPRVGASDAVQWEDLQLATELAPFEESRVWTGERYQLPGDRVVALPEAAPQPQREPEPAPAFEVLGTAASAGSGLAVIRIGNGTPQLVSLGQRLEGYEVASIDNGQVTMRNADRSLNLSVASAAPTGTATGRNARQPQGRNQGNTNARGNVNGAARPAGGGGGGVAGAVGQANPAAREQIVRQLENLGQMMGPGTQVQVNGNQVTVTGPNGQQRVFAPGGFAPGGGTPPTEVQVREFPAGSVPATRGR